MERQTNERVDEMIVARSCVWLIEEKERHIEDRFHVEIVYGARHHRDQWIGVKGEPDNRELTKGYIKALVAPSESITVNYPEEIHNVLINPAVLVKLEQQSKAVVIFSPGQRGELRILGCDTLSVTLALSTIEDLINMYLQEQTNDSGTSMFPSPSHRAKKRLNKELRRFSLNDSIIIISEDEFTYMNNAVKRTILGWLQENQEPQTPRHLAETRVGISVPDSPDVIIVDTGLDETIVQQTESPDTSLFQDTSFRTPINSPGRGSSTCVKQPQPGTNAVNGRAIIEEVDPPCEPRNLLISLAEEKEDSEQLVSKIISEDAIARKNTQKPQAAISQLLKSKSVQLDGLCLVCAPESTCVATAQQNMLEVSGMAGRDRITAGRASNLKRKAAQLEDVSPALRQPNATIAHNTTAAHMDTATDIETNTKVAASGQPKVATFDQPKVTTSNQTKVATSADQPKVATCNQPKVAASDQPKMATSDQPKVAASDQPKVATSDQPKVATSDQPKVAISVKPKVAASDQPKVATSDQPKVAISVQPKVAISVQPKMAACDQSKVAAPKQNKRVKLTPPSVADVNPTQQQQGQSESSRLRYIVIDGSNLAMSHGNGKIFSCKGIQLCVNYFRQRGHKEITAFVPQWRTQTAVRSDYPISDQYLLNQLKADGVLVFTPSRRVQGKNIVCYDDRFHLRLAATTDGVIVSNDNFRDLWNDVVPWREVIEKRLLMYSFVGDLFMVPDDPLGRNGPTLDELLTKPLPFTCSTSKYTNTSVQSSQQLQLLSGSTLKLQLSSDSSLQQQLSSGSSLKQQLLLSGSSLPQQQLLCGSSLQQQWTWSRSHLQQQYTSNIRIFPHWQQRQAPQAWYWTGHQWATSGQTWHWAGQQR